MNTSPASDDAMIAIPSLPDEVGNRYAGPGRGLVQMESRGYKRNLGLTYCNFGVAFHTIFIMTVI